LDNLKEIIKSLKTYIFPKWNQEEIKNLNRLIISNEIESGFKKLPINKSPGPDSFTVNSTKHLKIKLFQKFKDEEMVPNSFLTPALPLYQNQRQHKKKRKKIVNNILDEHDTNILNKILVS